MNETSDHLGIPDDWPCGLISMDASGNIEHVNATLLQWLELEISSQDRKITRFIDILTRAGRIYFETHLRPLLVMNGSFSEISIELERKDGTRLSVYLNGKAKLSDGKLIKAHFCVFRNEQRQAFERELMAKRRISEEFRSLVRSSPNAIVSVDTNLCIHAWNRAAEQLFGYSETEALGQRFDLLLIPPEDLATFADDQLRVVAGEIIRSEFQRLHKDGRRVEVEKSISAVYDDTHEYLGFMVVYSDISLRKNAEAQIQTLMQEINHRSKNLLSVIQSIARQTDRNYDGAEFLDVFSKRLASLASNQDVLIQSRGNQADLDALIRAQFSHLIDPADKRVTIGGPTVELNEAVSQAVAMAIFELITNAAKYGALSEQNGQIELSWIITDDAQRNLEISWLETNGPIVTEPSRKGFGFQVTGPILESITSGQTSRQYAPKGFRWSLVAPLKQMT